MKKITIALSEAGELDNELREYPEEIRRALAKVTTGKIAEASIKKLEW